MHNKVLFLQPQQTVTAKCHVRRFGLPRTLYAPKVHNHVLISEFVTRIIL